MSTPLRLRVNPITCEGHGLCAELLPELIRLDDWGYPIIEHGPVPERMQTLAKRAANACPTLALILDSAPSGPAQLAARRAERRSDPPAAPARSRTDSERVARSGS